MYPEDMSPDVKELAAEIEKVKDPKARRRLIEAMKIMTDVYLGAPTQTSEHMTKRKASANEEEDT